MAAKKDDKATEKDRIKKQLGVLGILVVLVVAANWKSIKKSFGGGSTRDRGGRPSVARAPAGGGPARVAAAPAAAPARRAAAALTPDMIPFLDAATKKKIEVVQGTPQEEVKEDDVRYDTRNPFIPLEQDDREIQKKQLRERQGAAARPDPDAESGPAPTSGGTMYFRGVIPVDGKRFAIIHGSTMRRPTPVEEGTPILGTPWTLLSIGPKDAFVVLYNAQAQREREKISVVHRDGVRPEELALAKEMLLASAPSVDRERRGNDSEQLAPYFLALADQKAREAAERGAAVAGAPALSGEGTAATPGFLDPGAGAPKGDDFSDFEFADSGSGGGAAGKPPAAAGKPPAAAGKPPDAAGKKPDAAASAAGGDAFGDDDFQFFDQ